MNILILHRVPYARIEYHRGIDHNAHQVTYIGKQSIIDTLPSDLRCTKVVRPDLDSTFEEVRTWLERTPQHFDRIISMSEYELLDAAHLRETFGVPGASVRQVDLARNKLLMKDAVASNGLRVPQYLSLIDFMNQPTACPWAGKTVIKPHSGASSVDVEIHDSPAHALHALTRRIANGTLQPEMFEVEEFVEGAVRHFDGLIQNGKLYEMTTSEYVGTCLAYMEQGTPLGSFQIPTTPAIKAWVEQVLAAVEIREGSFHLEAIMDGEDPVFLEVGNRVGGADVVTTFEMATGVHLPSLELRIHIETTPIERTAPPVLDRGSFGWFVFAGHTQLAPTFAGLSAAEVFRDDKAVVQWHELSFGAALPQHVTYSAHEAPLTGIVKFTSSEQTRAWIERLFERVTLRSVAEEVA